MLTAVTTPETGAVSPLSANTLSALINSPFLTTALPFTETAVSEDSEINRSLLTSSSSDLIEATASCIAKT